MRNDAILSKKTRILRNISKGIKGAATPIMLEKNGGLPRLSCSKLNSVYWTAKKLRS